MCLVSLVKSNNSEISSTSTAACVCQPSFDVDDFRALKLFISSQERNNLHRLLLAIS